MHGDALFHLARIRKLGELGELTLRALDEFPTAACIPATRSRSGTAGSRSSRRSAGLDPTSVIVHESSLLAPLAFVLAYELGHAVFRSRAAGVATLLAQVGMIALAPGGAGAYRTLELRADRAPAARAGGGDRLLSLRAHAVVAAGAALAAAAMSLAFVHPTYALFLADPLAGFAPHACCSRTSCA